MLPFRCAAIRAVDGRRTSPWDEKPYEITPTGDKAYLDEEDVVTFLDPPNDLIPLEPSSYNPAAYLWLVVLFLLILIFILLVILHSLCGLPNSVKPVKSTL